MILRRIDTNLLVLFSTLLILSINQRVFAEPMCVVFNDKGVCILQAEIGKSEDTSGKCKLFSVPQADGKKLCLDPAVESQASAATQEPGTNSKIPPNTSKAATQEPGTNSKIPPNTSKAATQEPGTNSKIPPNTSKAATQEPGTNSKIPPNTSKAATQAPGTNSKIPPNTSKAATQEPGTNSKIPPNNLKSATQAPETNPTIPPNKPKATTQAPETNPTIPPNKPKATTQAPETNPTIPPNKSKDKNEKKLIIKEELLGTRDSNDTNAQRISFAGIMDPQYDHYNSASSHSSQFLTILLISAVTTYFVLL